MAEFELSKEVAASDDASFMTLRIETIRRMPIRAPCLHHAGCRLSNQASARRSDDDQGQC
jgi:hypothetical protein